MEDISDEIQSHVLNLSKEETLTKMRDMITRMSPEARQHAEQYIRDNKDDVDQLKMGLAEGLHGQRQQLGGSRKRRKSKRSKKKSKKKKSKKKKSKRRKSKRRR